MTTTTFDPPIPLDEFVRLAKKGPIGETIDECIARIKTTPFPMKELEDATNALAAERLKLEIREAFTQAGALIASAFTDKSISADELRGMIKMQTIFHKQLRCK
jgi:hypothetical protein